MVRLGIMMSVHKMVSYGNGNGLYGLLKWWLRCKHKHQCFHILFLCVAKPLVKRHRHTDGTVTWKMLSWDVLPMFLAVVSAGSEMQLICPAWKAGVDLIIQFSSPAGHRWKHNTSRPQHTHIGSRYVSRGVPATAGDENKPMRYPGEHDVIRGKQKYDISIFGSIPGKCSSITWEFVKYPVKCE